MKIVQFMASTDYGGAEKAFVELSNELATRNDVIAILLRNCLYRNRFSKNVSLVELTSNPTRHNLFLHFELYKVLDQIKPDIVQTHAAKGAELVRIVNRFLRFNHVATKTNDRKGRVFNKLNRVVAVSEKVKQSIHAGTEAVIDIIHNGVIAEETNNKPKADVFTILAIGRLDKIKGFDLLIEQVKDLRFPYRLNIVGDGPEKTSLQDHINTLQLQTKVSLVGFRDDIAQMMSDAHLVVISSHQEGFSIVLLESLFYAPVLISTPVGAIPEILPGQFQVSQSHLGEKIADVHKNYAFYVEQFELLRQEKKKEFTLENTARQYEEVYRDILEAWEIKR